MPPLLDPYHGHCSYLMGLKGRIPNRYCQSSYRNLQHHLTVFQTTITQQQSLMEYNVIYIVHQVKNYVSPYADIATGVHNMILREAMQSNQIYVVFDTYEALFLNV